MIIYFTQGSVFGIIVGLMVIRPYIALTYAACWPVDPAPQGYVGALLHAARIFDATPHESLTDAPFSWVF